jgi:hypothetical protein
MSQRQQISTLWIVVMINMVFADILSFMYPEFLAQVSTGTIDGVTITPMFMLVAAVLIEVGILMIYLTHVLSPKATKIANLAAVVLTIVFVVGGGSLKPHYIFFATVEVLALLYIGSLAWRLRNETV